MPRRHDDDEIPSLHNPPPREVLDEKPMPLRVPLTPEEQRAKGLVLADLGAKALGLGAADERERLGVLARILAVRYDVSSCSEVRAVDCEVIADYDRGVVETIRIDTGAVVSSRPLTQDDRQRRLQ